MAPKANSSKRAALTQEYKIQLGSEIKDNDNIIDIHKQIRAITANQEANHLQA